jgi:hypothetical protein
MDMPILWAEGTRVREAVTATEAARVTVVHATETSAQEPATAWDSATIHIRDAED